MLRIWDPVPFITLDPGSGMEKCGIWDKHPGSVQQWQWLMTNRALTDVILYPIVRTNAIMLLIQKYDMDRDPSIAQQKQGEILNF